MLCYEEERGWIAAKEEEEKGRRRRRMSRAVASAPLMPRCRIMNCFGGMGPEKVKEEKVKEERVKEILGYKGQ